MEESLLSRGVRSCGGGGGAGAGAELRGGNPHRVPPAAGGGTAGGGNADLRGRGRLLATRVGRLRAGGTGWHRNARDCGRRRHGDADDRCPVPLRGGGRAGRAVSAAVSVNGHRAVFLDRDGVLNEVVVENGIP